MGGSMMPLLLVAMRTAPCSERSGRADRRPFGDRGRWAAGEARRDGYGRDGAARIFIKSTTSRAASATSLFTTR